MNIRKKVNLIIIVALILSLVWVGGAAAKSSGKLEICHQKGNGSFSLIKINANTLQNHLSHGDAAPGEAVPGQAGMVFSANCSVVSTVQNEQVQPATVLSTKTNNGKKADKVYVCHKRGKNEAFILLNINGNALPAHLAHGDALPNGWVPGQPGKQFDASCGITEVPKEELVQSMTVLSNGVPTGTMTLENGQLYKIKVTGTYKYNDVAGDWADAEYFQHGVDGIIKGDTQYPLNPNILDLSIGSCSTNFDWGEYQENHEYTTEVTGTGVPLNFCIFDSYYADNAGGLMVEIWKINW